VFALEASVSDDLQPQENGPVSRYPVSRPKEGQTDQSTASGGGGGGLGIKVPSWHCHNRPVLLPKTREESHDISNHQGSWTSVERVPYHVIQRMWHPTLNQGKLPANFTHRCNQRVWLRCPGCTHGCGTQHEWEVRVYVLTRNGDLKVCPYCSSMGGYPCCSCMCQSVANKPRLSKEWHSDNPPATQVAKNSRKKFLWVCPGGHPPYKASCKSRCCGNTGCPECGLVISRTTRHPAVSVGRPDLAGEWDHEGNTKSPGQVTLGSHYKAWWICSSNPNRPSWQAVVKSRALCGSGCPACMKKFKPRKFGPDGK
jgi:hypothetical protein